MRPKSIDRACRMPFAEASGLSESRQMAAQRPRSEPVRACATATHSTDHHLPEPTTAHRRPRVPTKATRRVLFQIRQGERPDSRWPPPRPYRIKSKEAPRPIDPAVAVGLELRSGVVAGSRHAHGRKLRTRWWCQQVGHARGARGQPSIGPRGAWTRPEKPPHTKNRSPLPANNRAYA